MRTVARIQKLFKPTFSDMALSGLDYFIMWSHSVKLYFIFYLLSDMLGSLWNSKAWSLMSIQTKPYRINERQIACILKIWNIECFCLHLCTHIFGKNYITEERWERKYTYAFSFLTFQEIIILVVTMVMNKKVIKKVNKI